MITAAKGARTPQRAGLPAYVPAPEFCRIAGYSKPTYYSKAARGLAPRTVKGIPREDVLAWLDQRAAEATEVAASVRRGIASPEEAREDASKA